MADEDVNNPEGASPDEGTNAHAADSEVDFSSMSMDELEALVTSPDKAVEEEAHEEEAAPESEEEEVGVPEDLLKKSPEELAKMYVNLRKLNSTHINELGELRKFKKEQEESMHKAEEDRAAIVAQKLEEEAASSAEELVDFRSKLELDPVSAIDERISKKLFQVKVTQARERNERVVRELEESTRNKAVPFNRKEVEKLIASYNTKEGNALFRLHGSDAYRVAYDLYVARNVDSVLQSKVAEAAEAGKSVGKQEGVAKKRTFTEPVGMASAKSGVPDFKSMSDEELRKFVGAPD